MIIYFYTWLCNLPIGRHTQKARACTRLVYIIDSHIFRCSAFVITLIVAGYLLKVMVFTNQLSRIQSNDAHVSLFVHYIYIRTFDVMEN